MQAPLPQEKPKNCDREIVYEMVHLRSINRPDFAAVVPSEEQRLSIAFGAVSEPKTAQQQQAVAERIPPWMWGKNTLEWRASRPWLMELAMTPAFVETAIRRWLEPSTAALGSCRSQRLARVRFLVEYSSANLIHFLGHANFLHLESYVASWLVQEKCGRHCSGDPVLSAHEIIAAANDLAAKSPYLRSYLRSTHACRRMANHTGLSTGEAAMVAAFICTGKRPLGDPDEPVAKVTTRVHALNI